MLAASGCGGYLARRRLLLFCFYRAATRHPHCFTTYCFAAPYILYKLYALAGGSLLLALHTAAISYRPSAPAPQGSVTYRQQLGAAPATTATLVFAGPQSLYYYGRQDTAGTTRELKQLAENQYTLDIRDKQGQCVYIDQARRATVTRLYELSLKGNVLLTDTLRALPWVVLPKTKQFGRHSVQAATATFHGRTYEAWFAPDLPLPLGPWKLGGLPGLILEAHDTDHKFSFEALAIDLPTRNATPVAPPTEGKPLAGWPAYCAFVRASQARYLKFLQASPGIRASIKQADALEIVD